MLYLAYNITCIQMNVKVPGGHAFTNVFMELPKHTIIFAPAIVAFGRPPPPLTKILNETLHIHVDLKIFFTVVSSLGHRLSPSKSV